MKEYRRKHVDIGGFGSLKDLRHGYYKNNLPMDLLTTQAKDF
jgi:hypothetical protein